jgi:methyl acetate hydrolase
VGLGPVASLGDPRVAEETKPKIDEILSRPIAEGSLTGVLGAVANRAGSPYEGAFGDRGADGADAMTPDTVIFIASMTKAVTGTAAMQLVERGEPFADEVAMQNFRDFETAVYSSL